MNTFSEVGRFLMSLDIPTNVVGYYYAKEGITRVIEQDRIDFNKILFSHIAEKFNTEGCNVERCIRTLVNKAWDKLSVTGLFTEKPTSREFIFKCAEYMAANPTDEITTANVGSMHEHVNENLTDVFFLDFTRTSVYDILS